DQRPPDERIPLAGQPERARLAPLAPERFGVRERLLRIDRLRHLLVGGEPREDERDPLALVDRELRDRAQVLAARLGWRAEAERIRPGERNPRVLLVRALAHPGDDAPVVEPDRQLRAKVDAALDALDDADDVRLLAARWHEVEHARDRAALRLPGRLEDERVVEVAAGARRGRGRGEQPAAAVRAAEQRGEAGAGVEAGEAEPVDGAASVDERRGLEVAEQRV